MTKDFENFLAANLAVPRVFELRRSADLFQTLERRFAAKFLQPGTGSIALELFSDLVTTAVGFVTLLENKSDPSGFISIFDFHTIVAEV